MAGLVAQLQFLSKIKRQPVRTFEEEKGALSGAVHSAIMDNSFRRLQLLIDVRIRLLLECSLCDGPKGDTWLTN